MMLYKKTKPMVHSPDGDIDFFDTVTGVLQRDSLAPFLFIIFQDYVQECQQIEWKKMVSSKKRIRNRKYQAETIIDADYVDDRALLVNTTAQSIYPYCISWNNQQKVLISTWTPKWVNR